nr:phosphoribosylanthranilate isomerase [uncultured Caproiciproducens sp.]
MTKVKICGLTRIEDIAAANMTRPDYIGFVFAQSRRKIDYDTAARLKAALHSGIQSVGVFVDEAIENIASLVQANILDAVQLHGSEDAAYMERLRTTIGVPIIKAVRVQSSEQILTYSSMPCDYLLLDTYVRGEQGGSGKCFDWSIIPNMRKPYFLAGGLNGQNVKNAVKILHPYCVDVSSGVETDSVKDSDKMLEFVKQVRSVR